MELEKVKMVLREAYELGFGTFYATIEDGDYVADISAEEDGRFEFCGFLQSKLYERVSEIPKSARLRSWNYNWMCCTSAPSARALESEAADDRRECCEEIQRLVGIIRKYERKDK